MDTTTYTHPRKDSTATMEKSETAYLLNSPANARKLMKSLDEANRGKGRTRTLARLRKLVGG